jgi:hypothetical protein
MEHSQLPIAKTALLSSPSDIFSARTSFRRNSDITEVPITPPMSPTQSEAEEGTIIPDVKHRSDHTCQDICPGSSCASSNSDPKQWEAMEVEKPIPKSPSRAPLRSLEDEKVHVEQPARNRLSDFEVKGTLGLCYYESYLINVSTPFKVLGPLVASSSCGCEQRHLVLKISSP